VVRFVDWVPELGDRVGVGRIEVVVPLEGGLEGVSLSLAGVMLVLGVGRRLAEVPVVLGVWAWRAGVIDEDLDWVLGVCFCLAGDTTVVVLVGVCSLWVVVVSSMRLWMVVRGDWVVVVGLAGVDFPCTPDTNCLATRWSFCAEPSSMIVSANAIHSSNEADNSIR